MIADKYNITAYMNRDFIMTITFDFDISSATFTGAVKVHDSEYYFTINKVDSYNITIALSRATINAYFEAGVYNYDLYMNDGLYQQILQGKFTIYDTIAD